MKSHDVTFQLPLDSKMTLRARNLDNDEIELNLNYGGTAEGIVIELFQFFSKLFF